MQSDIITWKKPDTGVPDKSLPNFVEAFKFLSRTPAAGHKREDLAEDRQVLFWPMRDYLIIYEKDTSPLRIVMIARGSRDIPAVISSRGL